MTNGGQRRPIHDPSTASRIFSGEAVIISPAENAVRMFNTIGSRIWELADGTRTIEEIAIVLTQEYTVDLPDARRSAEVFVEELIAKQLLAWA